MSMNVAIILPKSIRRHLFMKRRIFLALLLFAALLSLGASKKSDELKRMSIFISNFTEQNMYDFDMDEDGDNGFMHLGDPEYADILLHFGIIHNIINNPKSTVKTCPDKKCPYGKNIMSGQAVTASIKRYFGVSVKNGELPESNDGEGVHYDGKNYHFNAAALRRNFDDVYYADVQKAHPEGNIIFMSGELYNTKNKKDRPAAFMATAKPHKWNGKDTWAILSLTVEWR